MIAAGGVPVAKHGNRAASSKSGAADVLEALGVKITLTPERSAEILKKINICFLFAQNYHIAMKYVAPIRQKRAGYPYDFQYSWTADQSGRCKHGTDGSLRSVTGGATGTGYGKSGC